MSMTTSVIASALAPWAGMATRNSLTACALRPSTISRRSWLSASSTHAVEAAQLAILSAGAVREWQIRRIARAAGNPARERAAKISANSLVRQARSLFSPKLVKFLDPKIVPAELPFHGAEFFSRESMRYQSKFGPSVLLRAAVDELDPDALKVFLLALCVGLRRKPSSPVTNWQSGIRQQLRPSSAGRPRGCTSLTNSGSMCDTSFPT